MWDLRCERLRRYRRRAGGKEDVTRQAPGPREVTRHPGFLGVEASNSWSSRPCSDHHQPGERKTRGRAYAKMDLSVSRRDSKRNGGLTIGASARRTPLSVVGPSALR